jgi:hypothetical protein
MAALFFNSEFEIEHFVSRELGKNIYTGEHVKHNGEKFDVRFSDAKHRFIDYLFFVEFQ